VRWASYRAYFVILTEVQERTVEFHVLPSHMLIHRGTHVVHQQLLRHAINLKHFPQQAEQDRLLHARRKPSEQESGEAEYSNKHVQLPFPAVHKDGSALTPIDLNLLSWQRLKTLNHLLNPLTLLLPSELLQNRDATRITLR